jgi:hypothetical protein
MLRCISFLALILLSNAACNTAGWTGLTADAGGEPWTILCLEAADPDHHNNTDALAAGLRNIRQLDSSKVHVEHEPHVSRIYYGRYRRVADRESGRMRLSERCTGDLRFIRSLRIAAANPFLYARPMPVPDPEAENPEWDLRNAEGVYSLQICYCIDKPGFPNRRKGALAIVRKLREEGEEAYYYHGVVKSHVCVGTFGADALRRDRAGRTIYSQEVINVQNRREEFKYNTEWLQKVYRVQPDGKRFVKRSFLMEIPRSQEWFE